MTETIGPSKNSQHGESIPNNKDDNAANMNLMKNEQCIYENSAINMNRSGTTLLRECCYL